METTCQASYPLNSENANPFGTFSTYLSCAEMAQLPTIASDPVTTPIKSTFLIFMPTSPSSGSAPTFPGLNHGREYRVREGWPIDVVCGAHGVRAKGGSRILHQGDVIAEFGGESAGR